MAESLDAPVNRRNYGFWSRDEQEALADSTVALAGAGGDGFQLGFKLAMMGVGTIRVADPESFEPENSNRVFAATESNCGKNKAEVFRDIVSDLPRNVAVEVYEEGVTPDNVDEFVQGADLVIDESELRYLGVGTALARRAIAHHVPNLVVMNIGFAGVATSYHPDNKHGFQQMMGIPESAPLDEVAEMELPYSRAIPYIPLYGDHRVFEAVISGAPLPSIAPGVDAASALGTTEAFLHLTAHVGNNRPQPTWAPHYKYTDVYTGQSGLIKHPRLSYYKGVATMYARSKLGLNPIASYEHEQ